MELFCGWELAYVFCLISGPHSHFKGRSTRGLDFLICLATESTTCMWDQLPTRADNPSASKYTPLARPHSHSLPLPLTPAPSSLLHCPSLYPLPSHPRRSLTGSGAAAVPFPAADGRDATGDVQWTRTAATRPLLLLLQGVAMPV